MINDDENVIGVANPHTVKKFELIEKYVEAWAQKLMQNEYCSGIVFIDCMCNSGEYYNNQGKRVFGTPVRVSRYLKGVATQYPGKQIELFFSDLSKTKIDHLNGLLPEESNNFHINTSVEDGNELLRRKGPLLSSEKNKSFLLIYDPFKATIDWKAIMPFLNNWGEVIINHMVSDSMRAVKMAKSEAAIRKYENTYLTDISSLLPFGSDKKAYEKRIEEIIEILHDNCSREYYISAFPFFNEKNAIVYNLIHCTSNLAGFKLYKQTAWKTFGGRSSTKNTHGIENQIVMDFEDGGRLKTDTDEYCFYIKDIGEYLQETFKGRVDVPLKELWDTLDAHPIFPSDGFKIQIKNNLKSYHGAVETKGKMSFHE